MLLPAVIGVAVALSFVPVSRGQNYGCATAGVCSGSEVVNEEMNIFDCVQLFYE
jgi:hypothetical protein